MGTIKKFFFLFFIQILLYNIEARRKNTRKKIRWFDNDNDDHDDDDDDDNELN